MTASPGLIIGLGTNQKWTSRMVRGATHSWCSHAWVEMGLYAFHAQPQGIVQEPILDVLKAYPVHRRFEVTGVPRRQLELALAFAKSKIGTPYDWGVILNAIKLILWRWNGIASEIIRRPKELHCSEFACLVLKQIPTISNTAILDAEATYPGKLFSWIEENPNFNELVGCPT